MRAAPVGTIVLVALVVACSWPLGAAGQPAAGLDPSWNLGLDLAAHDGLAWGTQIIFTYGPLGFLSTEYATYGGQWLLQVLYVAGLSILTATVVLTRLRVAIGLLPAALATYLLLVLAIPNQVAVLAAVIAIAAISSGGEWSRRSQVAFAAGFGAFAGFHALGKLSTGTGIVVVGLIAVAALPTRRRALPVYIASGFATTFVLWLAAGQPLGSFDDYVRTAAAIGSGYPDVLSFEDPSLASEYAAALVVYLAGVAAAFLTGATATRDARLPLVAAWTVLSFFAFKAGFVRHDTGHAFFFFSTAFGGIAAFAWHRAAPSTAVAVLAVAFVAALSATVVKPAELFNPRNNLAHLRGTARDLTGDRFSATRSAGRDAILAAEPVPASMLARIGRRPVHAEPWAVSVVWANGLNWRPLPVFQSYSAYTPSLDERNADTARSARGPSRILLQPTAFTSINTRYTPFDAPRATREILCRYRPVEADLRWMLLARAVNRCGAVRSLGAPIRRRWNEPVDVPAPTAPDRIVGVRAEGVGIHGLERVRSLLWRSFQRQVVLDGVPHLVVSSAPAAGLLLRAAPRTDFRQPFGQVPGARRIAFAKQGGSQAGEIVLRFYELEARPLTRKRP